MSDTFAGTTADVYTDPATHSPVVGAQLLVYTAATGGTQITNLTDWAGTSLPGYVTTDSVGAFSFKTVDSYSIVWIQDPSGARYQCQSRESVIAGVNAAAQIPQLQTDTTSAVNAANSATAFTSTMGSDIQFQGMVSGVGSVNVQTATPIQSVQLAVSTTGVIQCPIREQVSGEWYVSHNQTGTMSGRETTVVDRLSATGTLLDTMILTDAGHGTYIFPQHRDDGNVWIWVPVHLYDTTGNILSTNLYRILYRGGTTITNVTTDAPNSIMVVASGPTTSTQAYLDMTGGRIVISVNGSYSLYDQADLETNGLNATKIGKTVPTPPGTVQGVAVTGTTLYRLTGADNTTNSTAEPKLITTYSLLTGQQLFQRDVTSVVPTGEPEGLNLWRDASGLPTLYMGLSTGAGGARTSYTFAMNEKYSNGVDIRTQGAVAGVDASLAVRAAVSSAAAFGAPTYIPAGEWLLSKDPAGSYCLNLPAGSMLTGPGTLKLVDGSPAGTSMLNIAADDVTVSGVTIDMNRANQSIETNMQRHGILCSAGNMRVTGCNIHGCSGDGILFNLGAHDGYVGGYTRIWDCERNGITFYGNSAGVVVNDGFTVSSCHIVADVQAIDSEPTEGRVDNIRLIGNHLETLGDNYAVTAGAVVGDFNSGWKIIGNTLKGALFCPGMGATEIIGNTIDATSSPSQDAVYAYYNSDGVTFLANTVYAATGKHCLNLQLAGTNRPVNWKIADNTLHVLGTGEGIHLAGTGPVIIAGNQLFGVNSNYGIYCQATGNMESVKIERNYFDGFATAIYAAPYSTFVFDRIEISFNDITNTQPTPTATYGIRLAGTVAQFGQTVLTGNNVDPVYTIAEDPSTVIVRVSGNQYVGQYSCSGTPEGQVTAHIGSTCQRRDGGTGTSFYVKESGTGSTGWIAK